MKSFAFVNAAAERAFRDLPLEIQKQFLFDLSLVQSGMAPASDFKVLKGNWSGVIELIENGSPAYRAVYCAKYRQTVYVLHAFTKTTNAVDRKAMQTLESRYKAMMEIVRKS